MKPEKKEKECGPKTGMVFTGGDISLPFAREYLGRHCRIRDGRLFAAEKTDAAAEVRPGTDRISREEIRLGVIAADRGLEACEALGIVPDLVLGDFDSAAPGILDKWRGHGEVAIRTFPVRKDLTDTELALGEAVSLGWIRAVILGGTGTRLDHVLGTLMACAGALERGMVCEMIDPHNRIRLYDRPFSLRRKDQWGKYVSLIPFGGPVSGLNLEGFSYDAAGLTLRTDMALGISNEIAAEEAHVTFAEGMLLVIESAD